MITMKFEAAKGVLFDSSKFKAPVDHAKRKIFYGFGAYVRSIAKNSIKSGGAIQDKKYSRPGEPPLYHFAPRGRYKDFIFYHVDGDGVVVGAIKLPRNDTTTIPETLEEGGDVITTVKQGPAINHVTMYHEARPHMGPAYEKARTKLLPKLIENSIVSE